VRENALVDEPAVGPDLELSTEQEAHRAVVTVRGELDAYSAPRLENEINRLVDGGGRDVVLDLSQTGFLDSSGLRAILTAQRRLDETNGRMALRAPSEPVRRLLEITGLTDHFPIES
jgi:anti-anti-sigma factor